MSFQHEGWQYPVVTPAGMPKSELPLQGRVPHIRGGVVFKGLVEHPLPSVEALKDGAPIPVVGTEGHEVPVTTFLPEQAAELGLQISPNETMAA